MASLPLTGIRVLDLSRVLAGPWASQTLADLGAEVIKVERPGAGDDTRHWGPPWHGDPADQRSAYFLAANRNKHSIAIDITTADGQRLIRDLAAKSDVMIENYKVGGLRKYGLDHGALLAVNSGLVTCSITGFGQTGPAAEKPGYDLMIQAMSGLMSITGEPDGPPQKIGVALVDIMTGLHAAIAILAALRERDRTGKGQHIDLALFDVAVSSLANQAMNALVGSKAPIRMGNAHPNIVPYQAFEASDGWLVIAVGNDAQFARLAGLMEQPELAIDPRFATNAARVVNREALVPLVEKAVAKHDRAKWIALLEGAAIPHAPINDINEALAEPQAITRGLSQVKGGDDPFPTIASPFRLSGATMAEPTAPPRVGQHTDSVLRGVLRLDEDAIALLRERGDVA